MHWEQEIDFLLLFQHRHSDVQTLFLWIILLVEHTLKTCIKQGANKSNYGRWVRSAGEGAGALGWGVSVWCGFSAHMPPRSEVRAGKASAVYGTHYIAQHTGHV